MRETDYANSETRFTALNSHLRFRQHIPGIHPNKCTPRFAFLQRIFVHEQSVPGYCPHLHCSIPKYCCQNVCGFYTVHTQSLCLKWAVSSEQFATSTHKVGDWIMLQSAALQGIAACTALANLLSLTLHHTNGLRHWTSFQWLPGKPAKWGCT